MDGRSINEERWRGGKSFSEDFLPVMFGRGEEDEGVPVSIESDTRLEISWKMWSVQMKNSSLGPIRSSILDKRPGERQTTGGVVDWNE